MADRGSSSDRASGSSDDAGHSETEQELTAEEEAARAGAIRRASLASDPHLANRRRPVRGPPVGPAIDADDATVWASEVKGPEELAGAFVPGEGADASPSPFAKRLGAYTCPGARSIFGQLRLKTNQDCAIVCTLPASAPAPADEGAGGSRAAAPAVAAAAPAQNPAADAPPAPAALSRQPALLCVLDGHGECGEIVSRAAAKNVQAALRAHPRLRDDPHAALTEAFAQTEAELESNVMLNAVSEESGACCCALLLDGLELWAAHVGDCRAVLAADAAEPAAGGGAAARPAFVAYTLTDDHKADRPDERARVRMCGAHVTPSVTDANGDFTPARIYEDPARRALGPGLTMTRAFGDWGAHKVGLNAEPEVTRRTLTPADRFVVVASDGVWEFLESQDAVDIVGAAYESGLAAELAALSLITAASNRWFAVEGDYRDDITVVVAYLDSSGAAGPTPAPAAAAAPAAAPNAAPPTAPVAAETNRAGAPAS